ncbi:MAG: CRISPR-associated endoribonuclease Cas6 [Dehalococcoidales bacterium]|nr:CRISPR-associated endoribonuclease Cas6 [Dehalococcoidales bacterium]
MLASFVVHLQPEENAFLSLNTGSSIHALFLSLIAENDPGLATQLHKDSPAKPFTVSPLQGKFARTGRHLATLKDNIYWLRLTTLTEQVFAALDRTLLAKLAYQGEINIEGASFRIADVKVEPAEDNPWGDVTSFEEIYEQADTKLEIALVFHSPTTFRQRGMNLPFPLPVTTFYSYWQKWNAFSSLLLDESLISWVETNVAVEAHHLQTKMVPFGDFQLSGFIGTCRYRILKGEAPRIRQLNALADLAFYAGTGAKTTMGMGQTRRVH